MQSERKLPCPGSPTHSVIFGRPPEILGEIFLHCLPLGEWGSFSAQDAPWLLTKVCHSWREIALSTPPLWSRLPMLKPPENPALKRTWWGHSRSRRFEFYLKNSMGAALSLGFALPLNPDDAPFLSLITPHLSRAEHLKMEYFDTRLDKKVHTTHKHFPLLKRLELIGTYTRDLFLVPPPAGGLMIAPLGGIEFPWAQLTQLTIQVSSSVQALALFMNCTSLEMCNLRPISDDRHDNSHTLPKSMVIHPRLRMLSVGSGRFSEGLFDYLVIPALSALKFNRIGGGRSRIALRSILIKNSSPKLTSLTLHGGGCSPQDLLDLSSLAPTITELDIYPLSDGAFQCLTVKSNSPHGVLFPRLTRLTTENACYTSSDLMILDMFYSRLYLAPNPIIIANTAPLQYAGLYMRYAGLFGPPDRDNAPICFGESYEERPELHRLVSQLECIYIRVRKKDSKWAVTPTANQSFPKQTELGYCEGTLPTVQECFFQKLDAAFTALEMYHFAHAAGILKSKADVVMLSFSRVPETALLHHPTYNFHTRATRLLKQWEPLLGEYEAKNRWVYEDESPGVDILKLFYRQTMDA
ncbi:hypothetical protein BD779DRAFT_1553422 [Infundibulicybe gibba]|nr:hypothetical protein BD779DRAFT_1553422 [Infundibulicybe gibba]